MTRQEIEAIVKELRKLKAGQFFDSTLPDRAADMLEYLSSLKRAGEGEKIPRCFECDTVLNLPVCPKCNPQAASPTPVASEERMRALTDAANLADAYCMEKGYPSLTELGDRIRALSAMRRMGEK